MPMRFQLNWQVQEVPAVQYLAKCLAHTWINEASAVCPLLIKMHVHSWPFLPQTYIIVSHEISHIFPNSYVFKSVHSSQCIPCSLVYTDVYDHKYMHNFLTLLSLPRYMYLSPHIVSIHVPSITHIHTRLPVCPSTHANLPFDYPI